MTKLPNANASSDLLVRQHERYTCRLSAKLTVVPEDAPQVSIARSVGDGAGGVNCIVVDCSSGGVGLQSPVFIPRGAKVIVTISSQVVPSTTLDAPPEPSSLELPATVFKGTLRVQRVSMLDRTPAYYLGTALIKSPGEQADLTGTGGTGSLGINALLQHVRTSGASTGGTHAQ